MKEDRSENVAAIHKLCKSIILVRIILIQNCKNVHRIEKRVKSS